MMTRLKGAALATLALSSLTTIALTTLSLATVKPAAAALFSKATLDPNKLILVASPYGNNAHQLVIVEQVSNRRACWSESGSSPTTVEPLLTSFDFTGICGRSTDANGYSIRMGDQDLGLQYSLRVVQRNGDLLLVGMPTIARNMPELQIGRAGGVTNGFAKLSLNPGWRVTRRVYNNQPLGHFYLTNDQPLNSAIATAPVPPPSLPVSAPQPSLPLPGLRPEIVITAGSTPSLGSKSASPSIAIPVPPPESVTTSRSTVLLPVSNSSGKIPVVNVPARVPAARSPQTSSVITSAQPPSTGKTIRVPLPAAATRPIVSAPNAAMQPPITQPSAIQPAVSQPAVNQRSVTSLPRTVKPGDFVVPTTSF